MNDLNKRGLPEPRPFAHVPGGLAGDCRLAKLYIKDNLVWEVAEYENGQVKVYMHDPKDLQDNDNYKSYV